MYRYKLPFIKLLTWYKVERIRLSIKEKRTK